MNRNQPSPTLIRFPARHPDASYVQPPKLTDEAGGGVAERFAGDDAKQGSSGRSARALGPAPVSVVVPCYRCRKTIRAAVASVDQQTMRPAEVILVEDGSADGTSDALEALAACYAAGWVRVIKLEKNMGPSAARNCGWQASTQAYVAFLDSDDSWHPRKLELQLEVLKRDPSIDVLGNPVTLPPQSEDPPSEIGYVSAHPVRRHSVLLRNPFPTSSVLLRRDIPLRFDEERRLAEDYQLWARMLLTDYRGVCIDQPLSSMHKAPYGVGGLTRDLRAMYLAEWHVRKTLRGEGLITRMELVVSHAVAWVRYGRRRMLHSWRSLIRPGL